MFMPQAASAPATSANRRVRSRVITVRSKSWRLGRRSSCTGSLSRLSGHLEVIANLLGQAGLQVALRQAFKELLQRIVLRGGNHGADAIEQRGIDGGVIADLVHRAVHEVGGGHVELPEVLGLPRRQRVGVDGLDVGEGHQGEHLQQLRAADLLGEAAHVFQVEDVAAHGAATFPDAAG